MSITIEVAGHATLLVRAGGFTLLCDPHLRDSYRGGLMGFAPARRIRPRALPRPDAVWISHSHRDHFDVASLHLLDRALPVLHPDDPRIAHALRRLGFTDTAVVRDWMTLTPRPGLELTWTPSTFDGPEHGLAVRTPDCFVWHMVDSLTTPAWVDRLTGAGAPDLLLTPCQPIVETRSVEGEPPGADADWAEPLTALLAQARPACVAPLPEGQYGLGDAAWLNAHKFPVPPGLVDQALRADDPRRKILRPAPGDRITVVPGAPGTVRRERNALAWARATGERRDRTYHPGSRIGPLAAEDRAVPAARLLEQLTGLPSEGREQALRELAAAAHGRLRETVYRFVVVDAHARPSAARTMRLRAGGGLTAEPPVAVAVPDIEVAVAATDLEELLTGRLGYSAAQYGGRLREIRPGPAADPAPGPAFITSRHDPLPPHGTVALSGIGLFALLLRTRLGSPLVELDSEIAACLYGRPARSPDAARARTLHPSPELPSIPSRGQPGQDTVWTRIGRCLARGEDPGHASGTVTDGDRCRYVGVLGRAPWPAPRAEPDGGLGFLLLTCLVEAQPHLGGGVRFPADSYRRLLADIEASPIRRWQVLHTLPDGVRVPRWRAASLFPVSAGRLRADLARRGWRGEILDPPGVPKGKPVEERWWLGLPPVRGTGSASRVLRVAESPGCRVRGLAEAPALLGADAPLAGDALERPDFRVWAALSHTAGSAEAAVRDALIRGDVRFSWLLPPRETRARAGRDVDPVAFAERVALLSLARLARTRAPDGVRDLLPPTPPVPVHPAPDPRLLPTEP
ncbi:MBL fold metallo-hydrolase [Streptomyces sp. NPDC057654]|uniref:MBL fold metallo-hydrolase n=1 Tax=Streptomyces sp. NPDC057654 TaxID=3346196 RepID=UPI0036850A89